MSQNLVYHLADVQFDYYTIIPHSTENSLLLLKGKKGWSLPHFVPVEHHFGVVSHINQAMHNQFNVNVTVLRCIYNYFNPLNRQGSRVYALENHSLNWQLPADAHWITLDELHQLNLQIPAHYNLLIDWFKERENYQNLAEEIPWAIPGWFNLASNWIYSQLDRLGLIAISPIEQVKSWPLANVMRINTNQGKIYFKATAKMFANEPEITQILTKYYPQHLPKILAIHSRYHWILMQDIGGETLSDITDIHHWQAALRLFARIQIDSIQYRDSLIAQGWLDLRLDNILTEINFLFKSYLSQSAILPLLTFAPQIMIMCKELSKLKIPATLMHGDLSPRNIFVTADNYLYFDWSDSCISHPFFDLIRFLYEIEIDFPGVPDIRDRLRDAYLEPWTIYAPIDRLISVFELSSKTLTKLYQTIISQQNTLTFPDNQKLQQTPVNFYIQRLLVQVASYLHLSLKNFQQT